MFKWYSHLFSPFLSPPPDHDSAFHYGECFSGWPSTQETSGSLRQVSRFQRGWEIFPLRQNVQHKRLRSCLFTAFKCLEWQFLCIPAPLLCVFKSVVWAFCPVWLGFFGTKKNSKKKSRFPCFLTLYKYFRNGAKLKGRYVFSCSIQFINTSIHVKVVCVWEQRHKKEI